MKKIVLICSAILLLVAGAGFWWINLDRKSEKTNSTEVSTVSQQPPADPMNAMYASMKGDVFDKAYLEDMKIHHQGALNMASMAKQKSLNQDILALSDSILKTQSDEVNLIMKWQTDWGYFVEDPNNPHASHMQDMAGAMHSSMIDMERKLSELSGSSFDKEFLQQMITHHQQAVDMSKHAEKNAKHQEVKDFAASVIRTQESEIKSMRDWQSKAMFTY